MSENIIPTAREMRQKTIDYNEGIREKLLKEIGQLLKARQNSSCSTIQISHKGWPKYTLEEIAVALEQKGYKLTVTYADNYKTDDTLTIQW